MATVKPQSFRIGRASVAFGFSLLLAACGGGGGGPSGSPPGGNPPGGSPTTVTVSGKITFDRIPFDATLGGGLNPNAIVELPARGVVVDAIGGGSTLATTTTNASGDYSLAVPSNTQIFIRARAQMQKSDAAPTWNFRVLNNAGGDALYVLDSTTFSSGTNNLTRNLRAASGWTGSGYTQTRAAAPFAILDTVYQATSLITSASPAAEFAPLNLYWSINNRSGTVDQNDDPILCIDDGDIQTTFYTLGSAANETDDCGDPIAAGIYVLGAVQAGSGGVVGDTDEFDQHIIAHEFGHYVEAQFSRSDSIGGIHADGDKLDLRVAFGEGWGNAFAGMVLNDPVYRDSFGGMTDDFSVNLEIDDTRFLDGGWFSEASIGEILWDAFDPANEPTDNVALGFGPIFSALVGEQRNTPALTSIYSFAAALEQAAPAQAAGVADLLEGERIFGDDEFGVGETNDGGDPSALPIYRPLSLNQGQQSVCVSAANGSDNTLGYFKFFRLDLAANAVVTFNVVGFANGADTAPAVDPDIYVYRNGSLEAAGITEGSSTETISQESLEAGTYVIEVYDFALRSGSTPRCMTVSASGT